MTHHPAPHSPAAFHGAARGRHSVSAHQPKAHGTLSRITWTTKGLPFSLELIAGRFVSNRRPAFVTFRECGGTDLRNRRDGYPLPAGAPNSGGRVISSPPARRYLHCHLRSDEAQGFPTDRFVSRTHPSVSPCLVRLAANQRSDGEQGICPRKSGSYAA